MIQKKVFDRNDVLILLLIYDLKVNKELNVVSRFSRFDTLDQKIN